MPRRTGRSRTGQVPTSPPGPNPAPTAPSRPTRPPRRSTGPGSTTRMRTPGSPAATCPGPAASCPDRGPSAAGLGPGDGGRSGGRRTRGRGRIRRFFRLRTVRVILALIAVFCCWVAFSVGQALTAPGGGSVSSKLAEWARDHYLGPVVTFGEWLTYQPPEVGGTPGFSLAAPAGAQPGKKYKKVHGFTPIIPARLSSPAGHPLRGEGV